MQELELDYLCESVPYFPFWVVLMKVKSKEYIGYLVDKFLTFHFHDFSVHLHSLKTL